MGAGNRTYDMRLASAAKTAMCRGILTLPFFAIVATAQPAANWTHQFPVTSPSARAGHALAYDPARGEVVLFAGGDSNLDVNDTWVWNGSNWIQKFPGMSPPTRASHGMAFDAGNGQVVLFGGQGDVTTGFAFRNDTWVWNGNIWIERFSPAPPPVRSKFGLVYDSARGQTVLFGGSGLNTAFNDTWVWNGVDWIEKFPATSPPARSGHAMVYDPVHGQVILFGGFVNGSGDVNDTWVWNGANWTQKFPGLKPPPRDGHAMAFDEAHGEVVLFGGSTNAGFTTLNDTWVWDGVSWTQKFPPIPPSARDGHAMSYDAARNETVLFGGFSPKTGAFLADTWTWGAPAIPTITAVVNGASFKGGGIVPGEIAVVFGTNLTASTGVNTASSVPLPTQFLNVSVAVNDPLVPILAVANVNGQQQINFQVPWELANGLNATVAVTNNGSTGASITVPVLAAQPGIFNYSAAGETFGAILHADFQLADTGHPAKPGETVLMYCTGLGAVKSPPADGTPGRGQPTMTMPTVTVGGTRAVVSFSGLAPGFVGLYQVNVEVPAGLPAGNQPLVIEAAGASSNSVLLPVE